MRIRDIRIEDFDYPLPDERIALHPLKKRDDCLLLHSGRNGDITHHRFYDLPELIDSDTLVVANETRVINARLEFFKETGSRIEIFLLEPLSPADYAVNFASSGPCSWSCMVGNRKRWKEMPLQKNIHVGENGKPVVLKAFLGKELPGNAWEVTFEWDNPEISFADVVEAAGEIPIPPYLKRKSEESDSDDYQTIYSRIEGSVAAPTAGLHFTPELISRLEDGGVEFSKVILHVGAGTFQPVKSEKIGDHPMHCESIVVERGMIEKLIGALQNGRPVLAVGTTTVRTLESLPYLGMKIMENHDIREADLSVEQWMPYDESAAEKDTVEALKAIVEYLDRKEETHLTASTSIMIAPGFRWRIVDRLITNFHQPKSTLLLLVSSFLNRDEESGQQWKKIYEEALKTGYRFLSYGDACLFDSIE